eukprot:m.163198 g.163198  ORF g.163198 m.163198 type:complete len:419 (+) comp15214_c0_seq1:224-1480(+)
MGKKKSKFSKKSSKNSSRVGSKKSYLASSLPCDLNLKDEVFDIALSKGKSDLLAVGLITGEVKVVRYDEATNVELYSVSEHTDGCRAVTFTDDGTTLLSASSDKTIQLIDLVESRPKHMINDAHKVGINCMTHVSETNLFATGDDNGTVKIWDLRKNKAISKYKHHGDFINDMTFVTHKKSIVTSSGDGTVSIIDWRADKTVKQCEQQEDEPNCVNVVNNFKHIVTGTQEGSLAVYKWGPMDFLSDRIVGRAAVPIRSSVNLDENTVLTGSEDGTLSCFSVCPNKYIGVVAKHGKESVEKIRFSRERDLVVTCADDKRIKFWSLRSLLDSIQHIKKESSGEDETGQEKSTKSKEEGNSDSNDEDGSDDEDVDIAPGTKKRVQELPMEQVQKAKKHARKDADEFDYQPDNSNASFFDDL